jgi:hypothetical protein
VLAKAAANDAVDRLAADLDRFDFDQVTEATTRCCSPAR